jgi:hypothetical protein
MTEAEWLAIPDVSTMLKHLRGRARPRKFRLFACACCRRIWEALTPNARRAVEQAERYADRAIRLEQLKAARPDFRDEAGAPHWASVWAARAAAAPRNMAGAAAAAASHCRSLSAAAACPREAYPDFQTWNGALHQVVVAEGGRQRDLLCEVFGNPFRPPTVEAAWLAWHGGTVPRLAQGVYDEGRFADLPVLADALEEAGCTDADVLGHCRSGGEHVRGCWVLDLLLGKK